MVRGSVLVLGSVVVAATALGADTRTAGATLYVNEVRVYTYATSLSGQAPEDRAAQAASVLEGCKPGATFVAKKAGKNWKVTIGDRVLFVCTPQEAGASGTPVPTVARAFARACTQTVALPPVEVDKKPLDMPPDQVRSFRLVGSQARLAKVLPETAGIVEVKREIGAVTLKPLSVGSTVVRVVAGETRVEMPVAVLAYAFPKGRPLTAFVTGNPADKGVVTGAAAAVLQAGPEVSPGVRVWARVSPSAPLLPGQSRKVTARVKAVGAGYYPFDGDVAVTVRNIGAVARPDAELFYSNNPENVTSPRRLYWAELDSDRPARLLYHHKNASPWPLVVRYLIANPTTEPVQVALSLGEGKPDRNPTRAGYVAGEQFMSKWISRSAEVVTVPPGTFTPITARRLSPGQTFSGIVSLDIQGNVKGSVVIIGDGVLPQVLSEDWKGALDVTGAWHAFAPRSLSKYRLNLTGEASDVYPKPYKEERLDYEVGGRFGFTRIGEIPILDTSKQKELEGNVGVMYDIKGTLTNPTPSPAEVEILFEASAGYGSGLFVLNGDFVRLGLINPKQEIVLANVKLPPGSSKPLRIQTMPLSGANYPVTLIVRPTGIELSSILRR